MPCQGIPAARSSSRIQPATLSRKYRSWVTATTVPGYSCSVRSSHATDSASRWLVGSSSKSRSGLDKQQAAQGDSPPLASRELRHVGVGGRQPQRVHRDLEGALEVPCARRVDLVLQVGLLGQERVKVGVRVAEGGAHLVEPLEQGLRLGDAVGDVAHHVLGRVEIGLLWQVAHAKPGVRRASPPKPSSIPAMIRRSDDLPEPFAPMTPILAPGKNERFMPRRTSRSGG